MVVRCTAPRPRKESTREGRDEGKQREVRSGTRASGAGWSGEDEEWRGVERSGSMAEGSERRQPRRAKDALVQVRYKRTGEKCLAQKGEFYCG